MIDIASHFENFQPVQFISLNEAANAVAIGQFLERNEWPDGHYDVEFLYLQWNFPSVFDADDHLNLSISRDKKEHLKKVFNLQFEFIYVD